MKPKVSEKTVAAVRERARTLKNKARQLGQAVREAKDKARQAKDNLKAARQEAKQARKTAKQAKREFTETAHAADEAAAELAAFEKQSPKSRENPPASSAKPARGRSRKRAAAKPKRRTVAPGSRMVKAPSDKPVTAMPVSLLGSMPHPPDLERWELNIQVPGDIAPVPSDIFAGNPPRIDPDASPGQELITNGVTGNKP